MQVRFSPVLLIESKESVARFQNELRADYPLLDQQIAQQMVGFGGAIPGIPNFQPLNVWRFSVADRSLALSLTSDSVTLETRRYQSRAVFLDRWHHALALVERIFAPGLSLRLGVRYVNRLDGASFSNVSEWIVPNLIGVAQRELRPYVQQTLSEANAQVDEGALRVRWGILPPNATFDPLALEPVPTASWVLDIDVSDSVQKGFSAEELLRVSRSLAERGYAVFRYAVTASGLEHFGASQ
jgi:uncharacterized protein (TIGR04255 family)